MTDKELIADTILHKKIVLEVGQKMVDYLFNNNRPEDALQLARRCARHDNSKFESDEMKALLQIPKDLNNMKDADTPIPDQMKKFVEMHWKHNRHHPEFFEDYHDMTELDIIEMVIDWYARSLQFKTDFKDFVIKRQNNRFHFDDDFFAIIWSYCLIIDKT